MKAAHRTFALIVVVIALAASAPLCACSRDGDEVPVVGPVPVVTLVEHGSEPRAPLRHALVRGTRSFAIEQTTETRSGEKRVSHTTHARFDVTIDDVAASGARLAIVMREIRTDGDAAASLAGASLR